MRRPGAAREAQRGDAIGVADEGASVSRVGGERAEKDHRVARGVGVELAVRAAPVREVGSVPVGRGGDRHGVVRSSVRHRREGSGIRRAGSTTRMAPPRFTNETAFPGTRRGTATSYRARTRTMCIRSRCLGMGVGVEPIARPRAVRSRAGLGRPDRRNLTARAERALDKAALRPGRKFVGRRRRWRGCGGGAGGGSRVYSRTPDYC